MKATASSPEGQAFPGRFFASIRVYHNLSSEQRFLLRCWSFVFKGTVIRAHSFLLFSKYSISLAIKRVSALFQPDKFIAVFKWPMDIGNERISIISRT